MKKIISSIITTAVFFAVFFIGRCSSKIEQVIVKDTLVEYRQKERIKTDSLKIELLKDSIVKINKEFQQQEKYLVYYKNQYLHLVSENHLLDLDSSISLLMNKLINKRIITIEKRGNDTVILLHPAQVYEINDNFILTDYYQNIVSVYSNEIMLLIKKDSLNVQLQREQKDIIGAKDVLIENCKQENTAIGKESKENEKKYKRQKAFKYVFKATTVALLVLLALK